MEAESHNWSHFLNLWYAELALRDEPNVELKCQSVHRDMMFLASNSLHNLRGQKWSCPCYHARHLQQIHWSKLLCGMYGLTAKSSVPRLNICQLLMRLFWVANVWHCFIHLEVIFLRNFSSFSMSVLFYRGSRGRWIENKFWSKSTSVLLCCLWKFVTLYYGL